MKEIRGTSGKVYKRFQDTRRSLAHSVIHLVDFLTYREYVDSINDVLSTVLSINTDAPQYCVLSAILYMIYTTNYDHVSVLLAFDHYAHDIFIVSLISTNN